MYSSETTSSRRTTPRPVKILNPILANQIAAGEVVERPASAIKELLENALDAGSTSITVEIREGGRRLIRVADNGHGMSKDDALLALERHATSKIEVVDDLNSISTLGFRGEALPSIASVSRLQITTRAEGQTSATQVRVEGGQELTVSEAAGRVGTEICIHDLFFNVPARRKFLKSAQTEAGIIHEAVQRLALAYPGVGFKFIKDGHVSFDLPPHTESLERVRALFGARIADHLCPVAWTGPVRLKGYISHPSFHFSAHRHAYTFINGRFVKDRLFLGALQRAFGQRLPKGRYPFYLLHLDLHPSLVDVNVHPAKTQVRFVNEEALLDVLTKAFSAAVKQMNFEDTSSWRDRVVDRDIFSTQQRGTEQTESSVSHHPSIKTKDSANRDEVNARLAARRTQIQDRLSRELLGEELQEDKTKRSFEHGPATQSKKDAQSRVDDQDHSRHERSRVSQADLDAWRRGGSSSPSQNEAVEDTNIERELHVEHQVTDSSKRNLTPLSSDHKDAAASDDSKEEGSTSPWDAVSLSSLGAYSLASHERVKLPSLNVLSDAQARQQLRVVGRADEWWIQEASDGLLLTHLPSALIHALTDQPIAVTLDRPIQLKVSPKEASLIEQTQEQLISLGLELSSFGGHNFRLLTVPKGLDRETNERLERLLHDLFMTSSEGIKSSWTQALLRLPLSSEGRAFTLQWLEAGGQAAPKLPPYSVMLPFTEIQKRCQQLVPF